MRVRTKTFLFLLVLGIGGLLAYRIARVIRDKKARAAQAEIGERAIAVTVAPVTRGLIEETITLTGEVAAKSSVNVVPKVSGRILRLNVTEGSIVKKGTLIAEIDHEHVDMQLQQAMANVDVALAQLKQAECNFETLDNDLKRMESLFIEGSITQQQLDQARAAQAAAAAQKEVALAQHKAAVSSLELARLLQKDYLVVSPIEGIVSQKYVESGDMASPQQPLVTISEAGDVKIVVHVPEDYATLLAEGETKGFVTVGREKTFAAVVQKIFPVVSPATRTIKVELSLSDEGTADGLASEKSVQSDKASLSENLRPGTFVRVKLSLRAEPNALVAPWDALGRVGEKYYAFVLGKDSRVTKRDVKIGIIEGNRVQILEGLSEGDQIVSSGTVVLRDGALVEVKK